jgi:hypothetical protein
MKKNILLLIIICVMLFEGISCRNKTKNEGLPSLSINNEINTGMLLVGKDIITEVILNPDTLGDPWEMEKVKNFNGKLLYSGLFEDIYSKKITVYDVFTEKPLTPEDVRKTEKEYGGDFSRVGKLQFLEDWYYTPSTGSFVKKIKSVTFAYTVKRDSGLPPGYKALFKLNVNK